jgi:ribosomal-protein-alanine N-acetyltransferase
MNGELSKMSAQLDNFPSYRRMTTADVDTVLAIENRIYPYPWTPGNFRDSLMAGYPCWVMHIGDEIVGYAVAMVGVGELHLLNLSIAADWQRRGLGRELLNFVIQLAREAQAPRILLEVRGSNTAAQRLYKANGFQRIGVRHDYYPAHSGREDAVVLQLDLS